MGNVQVRLPDDLEDDLDRYAGEIQTSRSEAARNALTEGLRALRLDRALAKYSSGEFSLERAARYAGVSLHQAARAGADRGIPYFRYAPEEAEADVETLRRLPRDHDRGRTP